jgi:hypothetical protein
MIETKNASSSIIKPKGSSLKTFQKSSNSGSFGVRAKLEKVALGSKNKIIGYSKSK